MFAILGKRMVAIRKGLGISQEQLAADTGLDRVAIGYIEQGRRRPTVRSLYKISRGLKTTLEELFKDL